MTISGRLLSATALVAAGVLLAATARAADDAKTPVPTPTAATPAAPAETPSSWASGIKLGLQIDGGITFNPAAPKTNNGQLFTDKPNTVLLNQILATVGRELDKDATDWDFGFKVQGMYGSDARYTHYLGIFNNVTENRNQFDIVEGSVSIHAPVITAGGLDLKLGLFPTPLGFETIDPSTNPFYSHSYIFNFGLPFKQTGAYGILHVTPELNIWAGLDTGVNTTLPVSGDNNSAVAGMFGFGLTLMGGNLTVLALSHIGPENANQRPSQPLGIPNANSEYRFLNDIVVTYKHNDKLTFTTELNYIKDDFWRSEAYGLAQYATYALSETLALNGRAEVYRDNKPFFVGVFPGTKDYVNAQYGRPNTSFTLPRTTYGEITLGVTWKPDLPKPVAGLLVRPEIRVDSSLNGTRPYNDGKDGMALTMATDFILQF
jgi:hypothetical protein